MANEALRERMLSGEDKAGEEGSRPVEGAPAHHSDEPCAKCEHFSTAFRGTRQSMDSPPPSFSANKYNKPDVFGDQDSECAQFSPGFDV